MQQRQYQFRRYCYWKCDISIWSSQIIKEATHILESSSSCIDFIFTTQPNVVVESGVHPSLHLNCHHQIVFAKFNLQIYYPPPYPREIWHYKQVNSLIQDKKDTFKKYRNSKNTIQLLQRLRLLQEKLNSVVSISKQNYYSENVHQSY